MRSLPLLFLALSFFALGCGSSARQVRTQPPRPADGILPGQDRTSRALLQVVLRTGDTELPADIQASRFRVSELWLRADGEEWTKWRTDASLLRLARGADLTRTLLSTEVPARQWTELALILTDVYAEYGPNAGGPLTTPGAVPTTVRVSLRPQEDRTTRLTLTLEPGASLTRTPSCRWVFAPFIVPEVTVEGI